MKKARYEAMIPYEKYPILVIVLDGILNGVATAQSPQIKISP